MSERRAFLVKELQEYKIRNLEKVFPDIREAIECGETKLFSAQMSDEELEKVYQDILRE